MSELALEITEKLRHHHKLRATAQALGLPEAHLLGHLVCLWLGTLEYAEDGDLWRGGENASLRFIRVLAGEPADVDAFVAALRTDRWLDGWLVHDWLDHVGPHLIDKYKSRRRKLLVAIWAKHGRVYGRDSPSSDNADFDGDQVGSDREVGGNQAGSEREAGGNNLGTEDTGLPPQSSQHVTDKEVTLNPQTLKNQKTNNPYNPISNPIRGCGGKVGGASKGEVRPKSPDPPATGLCSFSEKMGLRVEGSTTTASERQPCGGFTLKEVFNTFLPILAFHGIVTMNQFHVRIKHCRVSPAEWMMLYLDKIHAVYRDRGGTTWLEEGDADPVAMTVAALAATDGAKRHYPSDAARELFIEIMADRALEAAGHKSRWNNKTSGPALALELTRRKGARGRLKTHGKT